MAEGSMYVTLFNIAGLAAPAWLLLIFLPKWKFTRWLASSAIIPALISLIYLAGVGLLVTANGFAFMRDFGSAEGVTRLLARQDVAMVAWIHILAFDQLVGLMIYRDNMEHRYVPLPIQSVILFFTFMLGPVGFLAYYVLRHLRGGREKSESMAASPSPTAARGIADVLKMGRNQLMKTRSLTVTGIIGIVMGLFCLAIINDRGTAFVPPEGDLSKAAALDIAVGLYTLTLAFFVPAARFTERGRKIWVNTSIMLTLFGYTVETIQILRGFDPRFSRAGSPAVQILGGFLFLTAMGLIVLFAILTWKYFRRREDSGSPTMLAARYGFASVYAGFAAGFWLSANQGSDVGAAGSILPLHALGFHGLQAIPAIALLLTWSATRDDDARKWIHVAGVAWLLSCVAVAVQTAGGNAVTSISAATLAAGLVLLLWAGVGLLALAKWFRPHKDPSAYVTPVA